LLSAVFLVSNRAGFPILATARGEARAALLAGGGAAGTSGAKPPWADPPLGDAGRGLTVADLFSAAGGFTEGARQVGYTFVGALDYCRTALATHTLNHGGYHLLGDITDEVIQTTFVNEVRRILGEGERLSVLSGGPTCKAMSCASGATDPYDDRNQLFRSFVGVLAGLEPDVAIMENVGGLYTTLVPVPRGYPPLTLTQKNRVKVFFAKPKGKKGAEKREWEDERFALLHDGLIAFVKDRIVADLDLVGYAMEFRIVNFADFGVPQERKRAVGIAVRKTLGVPPAAFFPANTHSKDGADGLPLWRTINDALAGLPPAAPPRARGVGNPGPGPISVFHYAADHDAETVAAIKAAQDAKAYGQRVQVKPGGRGNQARRLLNPDEPSKTVTCNNGQTFGHPTEPRLMTAHEMARLQTFPDGYQFQGPVGPKEGEHGQRMGVYEEVGNAVPPLFSRLLFARVAEVLKVARAGDPVPALQAPSSSAGVESSPSDRGAAGIDVAAPYVTPKDSPSLFWLFSQNPQVRGSCLVR